jgi:hypothetical protein
VARVLDREGARQHRCGRYREHEVHVILTTTQTVPIIDTVASLCLPPKLDPTIKCKIDAFRAVETKVEARMISSWKSDDKLSSLLHENVGTT